MNGTLEDTTPAGVLQVLSSQRKTGAVRFLGESGCTVYLHEGQLYFAEAAETAEDLAVALVRPGRLSAEEWDRCTETGYPTQTVGEELIDTGSITRDLLASVVLSVIYDPLIQLFRAPEGDYEFAPDVVHWIGPYRTFSIAAIVSEVRRRTREADEMAPLVPSLDAVVRSARTLPSNRGSVNLKRDDWEVVVAASTGLTVNELAVELGRGRWSTARLVYRLAGADLLMVTAGDDGNFEPSAGLAEPDLATGPSTFAPNDGPPPLDVGAFAPGEADAEESDPWALPDDSTDGGWQTEATPTTESASDPWAAPVPEPSADDWAAPIVDEDTGEDHAVETSFDEFVTSTDEPDSGDLSEWGASTLTAVPDLDEGSGAQDDSFQQSVEGDFEAPALHPDIAKALAESTYADSATAINAMAARLGASEGDDEDDWDTGAGEAGAGDSFWSEGGDGESGEKFDFIWEPAVWDTGVESAPLPQREHVAPEGGPAERQPGAADPAWLNSLYTQFMPGEGGSGAAPAGAEAPKEAADPGAAPKQRTLKRLMSAIKRL